MNNGRMWKSWFALVGMNLLGGIPAIVPVWLLWYFLANWPLAALGWSEPEPTENDGMLPWLIVGGPVVALFALVWWFANRAVLRRIGLTPRMYWPVSALVTLVPSLTLMIVL
ncbi:hypothetical protein [Streptomyces sp. NPDC047718]|uniref:hypothetical protein n=1 Tax=Streptomyces sp. NPDC047718 TaxID=3155479 RepID=UPI0033CFE9A7